MVRFMKPRRILEVGAGYTSLFLLQALQDNASEIAALRARASHVAFKPTVSPLGSRSAGSGESKASEIPTLHGLATFTPQRVPWNVPGSLDRNDSNSSAAKRSSSSDNDNNNSDLAADARNSDGHSNVEGTVRKCGGTPRLDVIDNMAHGHTTANLVAQGADQLGLRPLLRIHQVTDFILLLFYFARDVLALAMFLAPIFCINLRLFVLGGTWSYYLFFVFLRWMRLRMPSKTPPRNLSSWATMLRLHQTFSTWSGWT